MICPSPLFVLKKKSNYDAIVLLMPVNVFHTTGHKAYSGKLAKTQGKVHL